MPRARCPDRLGGRWPGGRSRTMRRLSCVRALGRVPARAREIRENPVAGCPAIPLQSWSPWLLFFLPLIQAENVHVALCGLWNSYFLNPFTQRIVVGDGSVKSPRPSFRTLSPREAIKARRSGALLTEAAPRSIVPV